MLGLTVVVDRLAVLVGKHSQAVADSTSITMPQ